MTDEMPSDPLIQEVQEEIRILETKLSALNTNSEILAIMSSIVILYLTSTPEAVLKYWNPSLFILFTVWTILAPLRSRNYNQESSDKKVKIKPELRRYYLQTKYGMNFDSFFKAFSILFLVSAYIGLYNAIDYNNLEWDTITLITLLIIASISLLSSSEDGVVEFLDTTLERNSKNLKESRISHWILLVMFTLVAILVFKKIFPRAFSEGLKSILWIIQFAVLQYIMVFSLAMYFQKSKIRKHVLNALLDLYDYLSSPQIFKLTYAEFMEKIKFTNFRQGTFIFAIEYPLSWPHPRYVKWLSTEHHEKEDVKNNQK